jgi:hypothetical protein
MPGVISQVQESCQFLFYMMKNPLLYRALGRRAVALLIASNLANYELAL